MKNALPICFAVVQAPAGAAISTSKSKPVILHIASCSASSFDVSHGLTKVTHGLLLLVFVHSILLGFEIDWFADSLPHEPTPVWFSIANLVIEAWPQGTETAV